MFTGLVQTRATVLEVREEPPGKRLVLDAAGLAAETEVGASIAVNGCCLTVVALDQQTLAFEAGPETLQRTNLGRLKVGSSVNLEPSLRLADRLGGHFVTGHVDAVARLVVRHDDHEWSKFWFEFPPSLTRQMASKGSIAVDGVSLTLVDVTPGRFSVALIPHTLNATTFGEANVGSIVNLETDLLAKYVEAQYSAIQPGSAADSRPARPG